MPNIKSFLKEIFKIAAAVLLLFIVIGAGIFIYYSSFTEESEASLEVVNINSDISIEVDKPCNVMGLNLHGGMLTYLLPETLNDGGNVTEDVSASENIVLGIKEAEKDSNIKAILLEIDSLGGMPVAGQEIALALKAAKKPTVALIRQSGASAGYMAATGADTIFASSYSDVGGIGVTISYSENAEKNQRDGIKYISLASGKFKDTGDPDKKLTQEEWELLMRDVLKTHDLFVEMVAENRNLPLEKVKQLADGSTMLGEDALSNGLIDKLGTFLEVDAYLKDLIGEDAEYCWY